MDSIFHPLKLISLCSLLITAVIFADTAAAGTANPGWIVGHAALVSPKDAKAIRVGQEPATSLVLAQSTAPKAAAVAASASDYRQLAEALENDPLRIYQFVRNYFEYVPYYGALKGPYG